MLPEQLAELLTVWLKTHSKRLNFKVV